MSSNIEVKLDVLNQKASPALYAASLANRPAASFTGRLFVDSDSPSTGIYRDTGTSWVQVADQGAGTTGTLQQVTTNGSSTTIGISTSGNGIGIGTTIPASNRLDIHSASGINATFNGTGTTNAALQFQLAGTGKWNVGNLYNSNSNDFIITDVVNTLNRVTVKNTGQTFIGADTTSSGLFVVNNASSDSHIVVLGANSPSIRIRDSGSSLVQNVGLGISTGTNSFIQGSASGNYCIFNSSSTASPILFGIYDAGTGNTQEAVRISAARNLLVGTSTDGGFKLSVSGTANITGAATFSSSVTATQATFTATANTYAGGSLILKQFGGTNPIYLTSVGGFFALSNGGSTDHLLIASTGAATFSNSGGTYGICDFNTTTINSYASISIRGYNRGGEIDLYSNTTLLSSIYADASKNLYFQTNGITRLTTGSTGIINFSNTPIYATNALALAGGLVVGDIYKSATGVLSIVY